MATKKAKAPSDNAASSARKTIRLLYVGRTTLKGGKVGYEYLNLDTIESYRNQVRQSPMTQRWHIGDDEADSHCYEKPLGRIRSAGAVLTVEIDADRRVYLNTARYVSRWEHDESVLRLQMNDDAFGQLHEARKVAKHDALIEKLEPVRTVLFSMPMPLRVAMIARITMYLHGAKRPGSSNPS